MIIMLVKYMVVKMMVMVVYNGVEIVPVTVAITMIIMMMTHNYDGEDDGDGGR